MTDMTEEVLKKFIEYVKEKKITVFVEDNSNILHIFKTPENAPWLKNDIRRITGKTEGVPMYTLRPM